MTHLLKERYHNAGGEVVVMIVQQLPVQSVIITSKFVSSNSTQSKLYSIEQYVIKFVSDLGKVDGFLWVLRFPSQIKLTTTIYIVTEILLKVPLITIP